MLALFFVSLAWASSPFPCSSLLTAEQCHGQPSASGPEYMCEWNPRRNLCREVETEEFNLCALYHDNPTGCQSQVACFFDAEDMECEVLEPGHEHENHYIPPPPQVMPQAKVAPVQPAVVPAAGPGATASGVSVLTPPGAAPAVPATQPVAPAAPFMPPTIPAPSVNPPPPGPTSHLSGPRNCRQLSQTECFGPSIQAQQLCMWDAEDRECESVEEKNAEEMCQKFIMPQECDAQLDCFWDSKDRECSEVKQGAGAHMVVRTTCASLTTETSCAGTASCFWDDNLCINVVQAVNVCQVYTTPKLCSTNVVCHWTTSCVFARERFHMLSKAHVGELYAPNVMPGYQTPGAAPGFAGGAQQPPMQTGGYPQQPGAAAPGVPGMAPQQPAYPGQAAPQPGYPGAAQPAAPQAGGYPGAAAPQTPAQPAYPSNPPPTTPNYGPSSASMKSQYCKSLSKQECFGPSIQLGEYCMWDAEDFECSSFSEHDAEGLCKPFGLNPQQCDAQLDCFWDEKDHECSDVKGIIPGRGRGPSAIRTTCQNYNTPETCAAQASCFWEQSQSGTACVNVVQALNVCRVLANPVTCSTNILCTWQGSSCDLANGHWLTQVNQNANNPGKAHIAKKNHSKTESTSKSSMAVVPSVFMVLLGFAVGVLATLGCGTKKSSPDDYKTPLDLDYVQHTDEPCDVVYA